MQTAAQVARDIQSGRLAAGQSLAQLGQSGLGQALGAAGQGVTGAMMPMNFLNQYGAAMGLVPGATYNPNFSGTQGSTVNSNQSNWGIRI